MAKRKSGAAAVAAPKAKVLAITDGPEGAGLPVPVSGVPMVNPEMLIAQGIEKGLPVETMEKLLAMRRELKAEWAKEQYFAALAAFQVECPAINRTRVVLNSDKKTERYRYAAIEDILEQVGPVLERHGFSYTAKVEQGDASVTVTTEAHHRDGHTEGTTIRMPIDPAPGMNKSQATVSAFSYARRISFCGAFGIMTAEGDDDGGASGGPEKTTEPDPEPPRKTAAEPRNVTQTAVEKPKGTAPATTTAQPTGKQERKLPDDPIFKGMKKVGVESYWLLVDGHKSKLLAKAYCEAQAQRIRLNAGNEDFLTGVKETIEKDILAAQKAQKEKKA